MKPSVTITNYIEVITYADGYRTHVYMTDTLGESPAEASFMYAKNYCEHLKRIWCAKDMFFCTNAGTCSASFLFETKQQRYNFQSFLLSVKGMVIMN